MDETGQIDWLDRQLREAAPYIDDGGFTRRVLQQLPAPQPHLQTYRAVILLGITLLATFMAYFLSGGGRFINSGLTRLTALSPMMLLLIALSSGLLVTALGVIAAVSRNRDLAILELP